MWYLWVTFSASPNWWLTKARPQSEAGSTICYLPAVRKTKQLRMIAVWGTHFMFPFSALFFVYALPQPPQGGCCIHRGSRRMDAHILVSGKAVEKIILGATESLLVFAAQRIPSPATAAHPSPRACQPTPPRLARSKPLLLLLRHALLCCLSGAVLS